MTRTYQLEAAITASASQHLAAQRCPADGAAPAARALPQRGALHLSITDVPHEN
jgi:hypothetical protein